MRHINQSKVNLSFKRHWCFRPSIFLFRKNQFLSHNRILCLPSASKCSLTRTVIRKLVITVGTEQQFQHTLYKVELFVNVLLVCHYNEIFTS